MRRKHHPGDFGVRMPDWECASLRIGDDDGGLVAGVELLICLFLLQGVYGRVFNATRSEKSRQALAGRGPSSPSAPCAASSFSPRAATTLGSSDRLPPGRAATPRSAFKVRRELGGQPLGPAAGPASTPTSRRGAKRVAPKRIARLMREKGSRARPGGGARQTTTVRDADARPALDLLDRNLQRRRAGPALGRRHHRTGRAGLGDGGRAPGTENHSDQGTQYTSWAFDRRCEQAGVRPSIGSVGDACDERDVRELLRDAQVRAARPQRLRRPGRGAPGDLRLRRGLLQPASAPLGAGATARRPSSSASMRRSGPPMTAWHHSPCCRPGACLNSSLRPTAIVIPLVRPA